MDPKRFESLEGLIALQFLRCFGYKGIMHGLKTQMRAKRLATRRDIRYGNKNNYTVFGTDSLL